MNKKVKEQLSIENSLEYNEDLFHLFAESLPLLVWIARSGGCVEYFNSQIEQYQGFLQHDDGFWNWTGMIHPDDLERTEQQWQRACNHQETFQVRHRLQLADGGYRWCQTRAVPTLSAKGEVLRWFGTTTDVDELKQKEERLLEARLKAEKANQAKSEFLANMTHDLRTPLTVIQGSIDYLEQAKLTDDERTCLDLAQTACNNLLDLIGGILDFSKIEAGNFSLQEEAFDLHESLKETVAMHEPKALNDGLELTLEIANETPQMVLSDKAHLQKVLSNLLENAIKFTSSGRVTLSVCPQCVDLTQNVSGDRLLFMVRDSGCGITRENLAEIFKIFTKASPPGSEKQYNGTGLGLAICTRIIDMMDGDLWVESAPGSGSTFFISLPMTLDRRKKTLGSVDQETDKKPTPSGQRVLLAEDDPSVQQVMGMMLRQTGCQFDVVSDGAAAIKAWREKEFDLILMDVQMEIMDGLKATRTIRNEEDSDRHIPIIALTAHAVDDLHKKCLVSGMDDVLIKPVRLENFRKIIATYC